MDKPSFDQPLDALAACHDRIEAELARLEELTRTQDRGTARAVLRYFDTAGELHHRDEDDDLFPLLRGSAAAQGRVEVAAVIDELEREHATMHAQWQRLRTELQHLVDGEGRLDGEEVMRFAWLYRRHMRNEAAAVLPFAREALTAEQCAALGDRMAARRVALAHGSGNVP